MKKLPILVLIKNRLSDEVELEGSRIFTFWTTLQKYGGVELKVKMFDTVSYSKKNNRVDKKLWRSGYRWLNDFSLDDYSKIIVIDKKVKLTLNHDKIEQICYTGREGGLDNPFCSDIMKFFNPPANEEKHEAYESYMHIFEMSRKLCPAKYTNDEILKVMKNFLTVKRQTREYNITSNPFVEEKSAVSFTKNMIDFICDKDVLPIGVIRELYKEYKVEQKYIHLDIVTRVLFISYYAAKITKQHYKDTLGTRKRAKDYYVQFTGEEIRGDIGKFKFGSIYGITLFTASSYEFSTFVFPRILRALYKHNIFLQNDVLRVKFDSYDISSWKFQFSYDVEFRFAPERTEDIPKETPIKKNTTINWI